jgi:hypothetical protein
MEVGLLAHRARGESADRADLGFSDPIQPSDDYASDLSKIAAWFRTKRPDYGRYKVLEAQAQRLLAEGKDTAA